MSPKILLLEDDAWLAESFSRSLRREFAEVRILSDPDQVFDSFAKFWPDVIIADVLFGQCNLFVLLNEMQSYDDSRTIPVVILSSLAQQISSDDARSYGVVSVLDKTQITPAKLRSVVKEILKGGKNAE